jgi:excisionase family DNA binding protein
VTGVRLVGVPYCLALYTIVQCDTLSPKRGGAFLDKEMITPEEAAEILRVNTHTVYRALRAGKLPGGKVGNQWRIRKADLDEHLKGRQSQSTVSPGGIVR